MLTLTGKTFEKHVLKAPAGTLVVVDFWAPWCQPCLRLAPVLQHLAEHEYKTTVTFGKVDTDVEEALAEQYKIQSIPTLLCFKDGKIVERLVGAKPKGVLSKAIDKVLNSGA